MGNCASNGVDTPTSVGTLRPFKSKGVSAPGVLQRLQQEKDVSAPSALTGPAFVNGSLPFKQTYVHFFWFATQYHSANAERALKERRGNRWAKNDGKVRWTVDEVSAVVNKTEGLQGRKSRMYELQCHDAVWRETLQAWLAKQGILLAFDFEPADEVQAAVHKSLGLFKKGYSFTVSYSDEFVTGSTTSSECDSKSLSGATPSRADLNESRPESSGSRPDSSESA
ncbi:hypothetical protein DIPPA_09877 [Diplonema papillatum]|nr:hypothetical protein DIPPA_09877 [Diplonema papillatum]|eukprot:gene21170-32611_t